MSAYSRPSSSDSSSAVSSSHHISMAGPRSVRMSGPRRPYEPSGPGGPSGASRKPFPSPNPSPALPLLGSMPKGCHRFTYATIPQLFLAVTFGYLMLLRVPL